MSIRRAILIILYCAVVVALGWAIIAAFHTGTPKVAKGANNHHAVASDDHNPPTAKHNNTSGTPSGSKNQGQRPPAVASVPKTTPDTGPGDVAVLFAGVSAIGALLHWRYWSRRLYLDQRKH